MDSGYGYQALLNQSDVDASRVTFTGLDPDSLLCTSSSGTLTTAVVGSGLTFVGGILVSTANAAWVRALLSAGTGIGYDSSTGVITNTGVTSVLGTSNQIAASAATGAVTLSLPQDIGLTSNVTFGNIAGTLTTTSQPNIVTLASVADLNGIPIGANTLGNSSTSLVCGSLRLATSPSAGHVLTSDASGNASWSAAAGAGVTSLTGTTNRVTVSAATGAVTLSGPQDIATSSNVQFGGIGVGVAGSGSSVNVRSGNMVISSDTAANYAHTSIAGTETSSWGVAKSAGQFSASAAVGDAVIRSSSNKLILQSGGSSAGIVINTSNIVGIGTATPNANMRLHVNGEIASILTGAGQIRMVSGNYGIFFRNDGSNTYLLLTASGDQYGSWNSLRPFYVNNVNGNITMEHGLGIGTYPSQKLDVLGVIRSASNANDVMLLISPDSGNYIRIDAWNIANSVQKNIVLNQSGGNVGIGISAPTTTLQLWNGSKGGQISLGQQGDPTPYMNMGMDTSWQQYICNNAQWTGSAYNYVHTGGYGGKASRICQENGNIYFDVAYGGSNPISWDRRLNIQNSGAIFAGGTFNAPTINGTNGVSAYQKNGTNLVTMIMTTGSWALTGATARYSANHGLGAMPTFIQFHYVCTTANFNWVVGDRLPVSCDAQVSDHVGNPWFDTSLIGFYFSDPPRLIAMDKFINAVRQLTTASWSMEWRAFRSI